MKSLSLKYILGIALLSVLLFSFQNCSKGFAPIESVEQALSDSSELPTNPTTPTTPTTPSAGSNTIGTPLTVSIQKGGKGTCNSVSFTQVPDNVDYFIGRLMKVSAEGTCDGTQWSLGTFQMDWQTNTLNYVRPAFTPPATLSGGQMVESAYDPYIVSFNGELWGAFECTGVNYGVGASSCIAPYTIENGVDTSRMTVIIEGVWNVDKTQFYSASVPKLLVFNNELYIYWTVVHATSTPTGFVTTEVISRGAKAQQETSGSRRMWVAGSGNNSLSAWDLQRSSEVYGATLADPSANSLADIFDIFTDGKNIYTITAVGSVGCISPLSPIFGCYRLRISSSTTPLGHQVFNKNYMSSPTLPMNAQEYTRRFKTPTGATFLMGQYVAPNLNGNIQPKNVINGGYQRYDFDIAKAKFAAITANPDGLKPNPIVSTYRVNGDFLFLGIFHMGCSSQDAGSLFCQAASSRMCATQGFTSGTAIQQHTQTVAQYQCLNRDIATNVPVTLTQLKSISSQCTSVSPLSGPCNSAIHHYCVNSGYGGGFGPIEAVGNDLMVTCLSTAGAKVLGVKFAELTATNTACTVNSVAGDSCRSAADTKCRAAGLSGAYGIVDYAGSDAVLGCIQ